MRNEIIYNKSQTFERNQNDKYLQVDYVLKIIIQGMQIIYKTSHNLRVLCNHNSKDEFTSRVISADNNSMILTCQR